MFVAEGLKPDIDNDGWVRGWGVVRKRSFTGVDFASCLLAGKSLVAMNSGNTT